MCKSLGIAVIGILLAGCRSTPHAAHEVSVFSKLPSTDRLEVQFESSGCFHHYTYNFTFNRTEGYKVSAPGLGSLYLSDSDLSALDGMLRFYRSKYKGTSSTTETIRLSQIRTGKVIASEKLVRRWPPRVTQFAPTNFDELAKRMRGAI